MIVKELAILGSYFLILLSNILALNRVDRGIISMKEWNRITWRQIIVLYVIGFILFAIGDIVTTYYGLSYELIQESNDIAWYLMIELGKLSTMIVLKSIWFLLCIFLFLLCYKLDMKEENQYLRMSCMSISLFTILNGLYVVSNNIIVIIIARSIYM